MLRFLQGHLDCFRMVAEYLWESFYSAGLFPGFCATFDVQHYANPAYNQDRGPVTVYSVRLHMGLSLKPWQRQ
jgi:hypothetical protein